MTGQARSGPRGGLRYNNITEIKEFTVIGTMQVCGWRLECSNVRGITTAHHTVLGSRKEKDLLICTIISSVEVSVAQCKCAAGIRLASRMFWLDRHVTRSLDRERRGVC